MTRSTHPILSVALLLSALITLYSASAFAAGQQAHLGCFKDQGDPGGRKGRDLDGHVFSSGALTVQMCRSTCAEKGFAYAGVQYGSYCFCGNSYGNNGAATNCNMACSGDHGQTCGGRWANDVYTARASGRTGRDHPPGGRTRSTGREPGYPGSSGRTGGGASPGAGRSLGCFKDDPNRDMSGHTFAGSDMTVERCTATCASKGFAYAGVQYGKHCFCDNDYGSKGRADNCNVPCSGNKREICGGAWANNVYATGKSGAPHGSDGRGGGTHAPAGTAGTSSPGVAGTAAPIPGWIRPDGHQDCISGGSTRPGGLSCVAPASIPDHGQCTDPRTLTAIDGWLSRSPPWPGAKLDCWGRWYGRSRDGKAVTRNNCQRPDTDGRSRCQYILDNLSNSYSKQLGSTLGTYVRRTLR